MSTIPVSYTHLDSVSGAGVPVFGEKIPGRAGLYRDIRHCGASDYRRYCVYVRWILKNARKGSCVFSRKFSLSLDKQ